MQDAIARGQPILDADMSFLLAISRTAHNSVLANSIQLLRNMMRQWLYYKVLMPETVPRVLKPHVAISGATPEAR